MTEGTVGSTGVSLAIVAASRGVRCFIAMPDDAAIEKSQMLEALGALSSNQIYMQICNDPCRSRCGLVSASSRRATPSA